MYQKADSRDQGLSALDEHHLPPPTGTMFVMSLYLLLLTAMWVALFMGLIAG